jgi:hypothetical protein
LPQTSSNVHCRIIFFGCQKPSSGRVIFLWNIFAWFAGFLQPVLHFTKKKKKLIMNKKKCFLKSIAVLNLYTYEASIDVSPIIRSFIRIKSARDGFPLTVGEVAFGDEQHSAPETVICTDEIPSQTYLKILEFL